MTTATMKNLNAHIAAKYPTRQITFYRGNGYFYFSEPNNINEISSIYVCYLNHMSYDEWVEYIELEIDETDFEAIRPPTTSPIKVNNWR